MISVLIPVYNYDILELVTQLNSQLQEANCPFEIRCLDDGSDEKFHLINKEIEKFENVLYRKNDKNIGRTNTRQILAESAKYSWLLFLDADVIPKSDRLISEYLKHINGDAVAIFGGFAYHKSPPNLNSNLRWKYGKKNEQKSANYRNKKPYKIIISANMLIRREPFLKINSDIKENTYGLDTIFGAKLKQAQLKVVHINNEVYHLGIESNDSYLNKKEDSVLAILHHFNMNNIQEHDNDLLSFFIFLKRFKMNYVFSGIYKFFGNQLKHNLTGKNPIISLLQLYKISFMCYNDLIKV